LRPGESIVLTPIKYRMQASGRSGLIVRELDQIIEDGGPVPFLREIGQKTGTHPSTVDGVISQGGYDKELEDIRKEWREIEKLFPHTEEVAWFLGMLFGTSGSVDPNPVSLSFTNANEHKRRAFRLSGEAILGETRFTPEGHDGIVKGNTNPSVRFHSRPHVAALGPFHKEEKVDTIWRRHEWVMTDPYVISFASGVLDSCGIVIATDAVRHIMFDTPREDVSEFYQELLLKMGVQNVLVERRHNGTIGVSIGSIEEMRMFAKKVSSVDPFIQSQLDSMKDPVSSDGKLAKLTSPVELVDEWRRLTVKVFNHIPSSWEIVLLRKLGEPTPPVADYIKLFGETADSGPNKFSSARPRLAHLITLSREEMEREVAGIRVNSRSRKRPRASGQTRQVESQKNETGGEHVFP